ncbi:MFS transporter [Brachybacterium alimentarium]|uniref:MFS transporter n=1 Tax=Brachybacterium alimentarium TaxID=47845 RepID=A0A2A3YJ82_9MICO|nr:MFS transporter [Brachybacterium alimentarium]PCC33669.1 MFS transporter [Brachybacterium alimentarium]PCC39328.1 MFS transporter [Brachybacterium alimentarium]RCS82224.1 MFS transporter [Brachybacterium alimentarium]RCS89682.1 MFS transporter [Brachybacterium alimentarium]
MTAVLPEVRRARGAVAAMFLTNGALIANILPRYPEIKGELGLANSTYGLVLAAFPAGAILAGLGAGALIRRFGSAPLAVVGTILTALGLIAASWAPVAAALALALLVAGACDAITDVAQNAHGLRVQRGYGRSIINSFHAVWSIGAVLGGSMAAAAIALEVPLRAHLAVSGTLFAATALVALRFALPGKDPENPASAVGADGAPGAADAASAAEAAGTAGAATSAPVMRPGRGRTAFLLGALVVIAIGGTLVEDSGNSWATLYLSRDLGAPAAIAATGFIALVGAQFVGRLLGDTLVDRFGQRTVARAGGGIIAVGMATALAVPSVPGTIAGFALAGLGSATLVPAAMQEADDLPGLRHGTGLTVVSWLMRLGFLVSPPLVGLIADHAGLRTGLLVLPVAGILVLVFSGVLSGRRRGAHQKSEQISAAV